MNFVITLILGNYKFQIKNGIRKQNNSSKYFFVDVMKSLTTIEIRMITNKNWKSKRKVE